MAAEHESSDNNAPRERLASFVRKRRRALRLSVREAAERAEVARGTWTALEDGSRKTADSNFAGIEAALRWPANTVASLLDGTRAIPDESTLVGSLDEVQADDTESALDEQDEAIKKIMLSDRLTDDQKRTIMRLLIEQRKEAERQRLRQAEEFIRIVSGDGA